MKRDNKILQIYVPSSNFMNWVYIHFKKPLLNTMRLTIIEVKVTPLVSSCLWALFDTHLFTSVPELTNALLEEWSNIPIDTLLNLVDSLPRRVEAVLAAKGASSTLNPMD